MESTNYGIPQARERIYFVGIRKDLCINNFTFPEAICDKNDITKFLIEDREDFVLNSSAFATFLRYLNNKYNKGKYTLDELLDKYYLILDTRQSDLRLYHNKIPTLRTGRQGILYIKNKQIRKLSGYEALLLQGFSKEMAKKVQDSFPQTKILEWAGNAMTVNVMEEIGKNIMKYLNDKLN